MDKPQFHVGSALIGAGLTLGAQLLTNAIPTSCTLGNSTVYVKPDLVIATPVQPSPRTPKTEQ